MNINPSSQISLYGHNILFDKFIELIQKDKLPNKILLSGEKGLGKCTLAYHLVNFALSKNEANPYDLNNFKISTENKSYLLVQNQSCPNFTLIDVEQDKKNIDINQIRELINNLNKSSFNSKPRFVLIDNIDLLNVNSVNALLKILEEPNDNIFFILINNNKKVLPTLKSRCINFKVFLSSKDSIEIASKILKKKINDLINFDLLDSYKTPGQLIDLIVFSENYEIDMKNIILKEFLLKFINEKIYKKEKKLNHLIYSFIEVYFRKNISSSNISLLNFYKYFLKKINNTKIYNLDEETLFLEFEDKILNG
ncbi:AAA family ATPase [Candidatus Pelagibacter sp. HIMB1623]|uniref:AAA family ATPase n=1 Tax=Candidatus Pelagibacter sp. HIMB1623 TaxID=3413358 RepID=UPI003F85BB29